MVTNRSVPTDTVLPHITYQSVAAALAWLTTTFGFTEHYCYGEADGRISSAQMLSATHGSSSEVREQARRARRNWGHQTQSLTVFVNDVDAHFDRARSAGTKIVEDLHETAHGERQYGVEDLDGHHWLFSKHARDVSPDE